MGPKRGPSVEPRTRVILDVDPELLLLINDKAANGRLRSWAAFTHTAVAICHRHGVSRIDPEITDSAIAQLGATR